jgi:hypothetical protein
VATVIDTLPVGNTVFNVLSHFAVCSSFLL